MHIAVQDQKVMQSRTCCGLDWIRSHDCDFLFFL